MLIMTFFFGIMAAVPVSYLFLRLFKGKFLWITNRNFAGALYGFWTWFLIMVFLYLDAGYGLVGFAQSARGFSFATFLATTPAIAGFITGGILGAVLSARIRLGGK